MPILKRSAKNSHMTTPDKKQALVDRGWWAIWTVAFIISLLPPIVHRWRQIEGIVEPLRYPWGLLPAELLFLRHLGSLSHLIPVLLGGALFIAIYKREIRRGVIATGVLLSFIFSSIYAAYCVIVLSMYLTGFAEATRENQSAEQGAALQSQPRSSLK